MSAAAVPPLAGLCRFEDARRTALSVEECVGWMKRHHYVLHRLHGVFTARLTAEPLYELKTAFSLHAYLCAEHVTAYRKRVSELREPPLGLDEVPHYSTLCYAAGRLKKGSSSCSSSRPPRAHASVA